MYSKTARRASACVRNESKRLLVHPEARRLHGRRDLAQPRPGVFRHRRPGIDGAATRLPRVPHPIGEDVLGPLARPARAPVPAPAAVPPIRHVLPPLSDARHLLPPSVSRRLPFDVGEQLNDPSREPGDRALLAPSPASSSALARKLASSRLPSRGTAYRLRQCGRSRVNGAARPKRLATTGRRSRRVDVAVQGTPLRAMG